MVLGSTRFKHTSLSFFMQHLDTVKFIFPSDIVNAKTWYSLINHLDNVR